MDALRRTGRLELAWRGARLVSVNGVLEVPGARTPTGDDLPDTERPVGRQLADELACFASWLDREGSRAAIVTAEHPLVRPRAHFPRFEPVRRPSSQKSSDPDRLPQDPGTMET